MSEVFGSRSKIPVDKKELKAAIRKANESLKKNNKKLEKQVDDKKSQLKVLDKDRKSLEGDIKSLSSTAKSLKKEIVQSNQELKKERPRLAKIKGLLAEKDTAQSNIDRLEKEREILSNSIDGMSADLARATALKEEIKIIESDKELGLKELDEIGIKVIGAKEGLPSLYSEVVAKKIDGRKTMESIDKEIKVKEGLLGSVDKEYELKMAELNTNRRALKDHIKEKEEEAGVMESLVNQREKEYIEIESKYRQAENSLAYTIEMTDKEVERCRDEKDKIKKNFKKFRISALEEVARLKLKKKIEIIDEAGLLKVFGEDIIDG